MSNDPTKREPFSYERLHPKARQLFQVITFRLMEGHSGGHTKTLFRPFEGFRSNERQLHLLNVEKTTKAGPWSSAHNYGLAVDYVPWVDGKWSWGDGHDWRFLHDVAVNFGGMHQIAWDKPHVEHPIWHAVRRQLKG